MSVDCPEPPGLFTHAIVSWGPIRQAILGKQACCGQSLASTSGRGRKDEGSDKSLSPPLRLSTSYLIRNLFHVAAVIGESVSLRSLIICGRWISYRAVASLIANELSGRGVNICRSVQFLCQCRARIPLTNKTLPTCGLHIGSETEVCFCTQFYQSSTTADKETVSLQLNEPTESW